MQIANLKCCQDGMNECVDAQMQKSVMQKCLHDGLNHSII